MYRTFECKKLKRTIKVSSEAIPDDENGWVCDCGEWTELDKENHVAIG